MSHLNEFDEVFSVVGWKFKFPIVDCNRLLFRQSQHSKVFAFASEKVIIVLRSSCDVKS